MIPMHFDRELEFALRAARKAGEAALWFQRRGVEAETKSDLSPVTLADRESERIICESLAAAFPEDGFLGEEGTSGESRSGRRWIIDPIDGTRDFVRGNPYWAVFIALEAAPGEVGLGVCHFPALERSFHALAGGGAYRDGTPIRVSGIERASQAVLCMNGLDRALNQPFAGRLLEWMSQFWAVRSYGGCMDAVMLAAGQADAWIEPCAQPWDIAPLKILIEEAGGRFLNLDGSSSIYGGSCVACVPALEPVVRELLRPSHV